MPSGPFRGPVPAGPGAAQPQAAIAGVTGASVQVVNDFAEGSDGTVISTANSAGTGENAFDGVLGSPVFSAAGAFHGTLGMATPLAAASNSAVFWTAAYTGSWANFYARHYFLIPSVPTAITFIGAVNTPANGANWGIIIDTTGKVGVRDRVAATNRALGATVLTAGTWNRYEFGAVFDGTNWTVTVRLFYGANADGVTPDETITSTAFSAAGPAGRFAPGVQSSSAVTWGSTATGPFHDDLMLTSIGWPGPTGAYGSGAYGSGTYGTGNLAATALAGAGQVTAKATVIAHTALAGAGQITAATVNARFGTANLAGRADIGGGNPRYPVLYEDVYRGFALASQAVTAPLAGAGTVTANDGVLATAPLLRRPVRARIPGAFRKGYARSVSRLALGTSGPPVYPLDGPVAAVTRRGSSRKGSAQSRAGTFTSVAPPGSPAPLYPLHGPVRARIPGAFRKGYARSVSRLALGTSGPPVYPLQRPAGLARRAPGPFRKGRAQGAPGTAGASGPKLYAAASPAGIARRAPGPFRKGRAAGAAGIRNQAGAPLYPLRSPVAAARPGTFSKGRSLGITAFPQLSGPQLSPLHGPVTAAVRTGTFRKGRSASSAGTFTQTGPLLYPLHGPVSLSRNAVLPFRKGRSGGIIPAFQGTGPAPRPLSGPVALGQRAPGPLRKGRLAASAGTRGQAGAPLYPLQRPAGTTWRSTLASRKGRAQGLAGTITPAGPGTAAPLNVLRGPVRARISGAFRKGYARGARLLLLGVTGPQLYPLQGPAGLGRRAAPASRKGRTQGSAGFRGQPGAQLYPLHGPAGIAQRAPGPFRKGSAQGNRGIRNQAGVAFPALQGPVTAARRAAAGPFRKGSVSSGAGVPGLTGPPVPQLQHPAGIASRAPGPFRKGSVSSSAGTFAQTGPKVYPLRGAIGARVPLPPRGRAQGTRAAVALVITIAPLYPLQRPVRSPARPAIRKGSPASQAGTYQGTGPALTPLQRPVAPRRPPATRSGRCQGSRGVFHQAGPQLYALQHPVAPVRRGPFRKGSCQGSQGFAVFSGPPVRPLRGPVAIPRYAPFSKGGRCQSLRGTPGILGPPLRRLSGPVGLGSRAPGPFRKGSAAGRSGPGLTVLPAVHVARFVLGAPATRWSAGAGRGGP